MKHWHLGLLSLLFIMLPQGGWQGLANKTCVGEAEEERLLLLPPLPIASSSNHRIDGGAGPPNTPQGKWDSRDDRPRVPGGP